MDDASDDDSPAVLARLRAEGRVDRALALGRHGGQQRATLAGLHAARGRWIVTLDDDGEHRPEDIPRLLARAEEGFDLVYGVGRRSGRRPAGSVLRDLWFSLAIGKPPGLPLSSFRVFSRELRDRLVERRSDWPYVSALAFAGRSRLRAAWLPVLPGPPSPGSYRLRDRLVLGWRLMRHYGPLARRGSGASVVPAYDDIPEEG